MRIITNDHYIVQCGLVLVSQDRTTWDKFFSYKIVFGIEISKWIEEVNAKRRARGKYSFDI